ncbi:MAG TPA: hypothetical protein VH643_12375 [Gemmataceae bacterium]|jgi:hypothetical protein
MDCRTARLLLDFARPQALELQADDAGALQNHLDRCPDCHGLARGERQLDEHLGKAVRQVEIPAGLRDQLLSRLEAERGDWHRRRFAHAARLTVVAAAAALLLGWAGWHWIVNRRPPPINPAQMVENFNERAIEEKRTQAEEALKRMGVDTPLPQLNYNLLLTCSPTLGELPGYPDQRVPLLVFVQNHHRAWVYVIAAHQVPNNVPSPLGEGTYKLDIVTTEGEAYKFLVIHDGDSLEWLRPPEPAAT